MSIKRITKISNMAVFNNFDWDRTVRDKNNNKIEFKKLNIIYGRNYSGKTTLSRIIRALETHKVSDKYKGADFQIDIEGDGVVSLSNLNTHSQTVRVFNEDFVKDNLRFFINESEDIQSFAILGDKNIEIETAIALKEKELGTEDPPTWLLGKLKAHNSAFQLAKEDLEKKQQELDNMLRRKANEEIKPNPDYKDVNYNINKIKSDIEKVISLSFKDINSAEVITLKALLKEEPKQQIPEISSIDLNFQDLVNEVKTLVEKKITLSNPIKELLEDSLLESWVRSGIKLHKDKRSTCGFCGSVLPSDLMKRLEYHFNKESEDLRQNLETLILKIEKRIDGADKLLSLNVSNFYVTEKENISELETKYKKFLTEYKAILRHLLIQLKNRHNSISTPRIFEECTDVSGDLVDIITEYNRIIKLANQKTASLSRTQNEARNKLRLHEVNTFLNTINYSNKINQIANLEKIRIVAKDDLEKVQAEVLKCKSEIDDLKSQLKDEKKGAEQVNKYLNNYFGHNALKLVPVNDAAGNNGKFKFEIQRDGKKAYNLSSGECSLVSFCYFMAKLSDIDTKDNEPIIWIDDPVSSLDANHLFFIYSLIKSEIVKAKKFKQLFISTHNLDFLKYLKRLVRDNDYGKKVMNFIIQRKGNESTISQMPEYMVRYVTEFNYLFEKIYQCANADDTNANSTLFYDFGNNARKFLELFLSFKFPNPSMSEDKKLECFLGESSVEALLVNRINNEYSHLYGVFERGMTPIDIPEMKKAAKFILEKVYQNDEDQFNSLMESIGKSPIP